MTEKRLNQLLSILDKYEISLDIDDFELSMLPNFLVYQLKNMSDKREIVETLKAHIFLLREKINHISNAQTMQNLYNFNISTDLSTKVQTSNKRH